MKQMQNTPLWSLISVFSCVHLVYSPSKSPRKAKRQQSLLSSNKITKAYLYIFMVYEWDWHGLPFSVGSSKDHQARNWRIIFQESYFKAPRWQIQYSNWPNQYYQCKWCTAVPVRKDDLLHVVRHEEVIKSSTLIPLHEGFLCPTKNTVQNNQSC